jgi:hypothetical protein
MCVIEIIISQNGQLICLSSNLVALAAAIVVQHRLMKVMSCSKMSSRVRLSYIVQRTRSGISCCYN